VTAFYGHHAAFGSFMELSLPIALSLLFVAENSRQRIFYITSGLICLIALIMTQARGPWIASFAGMVTVAILFRHRIMRHKRKVLFSILFLLGIVISAAPLYMKRAATLVDPQWASNYIRVMIWQSTLQMIHDYPLVGVGLDRFSYIYNPFYLNPLSPERFHAHGHNTYLTFAAECGLIGLIAFMALLYNIFHTLWIQMKVHSQNPYVIACIGIFIALLVNSLVDRIFWEARLAKLFWLFMGLMIYDSAPEKE
jgi:O-antigen ligase